jgi:glycine hydroxymethyltransferase
MILEVLDGLVANGEEKNGAVEEKVKQQAIELCGRFPIYKV